MVSSLIISFYRLWHGKLKLKGAGRLLTSMSRKLKKLQHYPLKLNEGQLIHLDFRDVSAWYWLNLDLDEAYEELALINAIHKFTGNNEVVWDIGANSGALSYRILKAISPDEIHLFEPNLMMCEIAGDAVAPFEQAQVHPFGLSDTNECFTLTIPDGHTTMATLEPESTSREGKTCLVECRLGDDLVYREGFRPPTIIKIDTEGHELKVFRGLSRTIREHRPVIFFEHISVDVDQVISCIPDGYSVMKISDPSGDLVPVDSDEEGHNSVLLPPT